VARAPRGPWTATGLATAWVALGSWVAVFPGTLERLVGLDYTFNDEWGVGRGTFEALALGTLGVVLAIALVGYALGRDVRRQIAVVPLDPAAAPAPAPS
jgi:hypothetical protein